MCTKKIHGRAAPFLAVVAVACGIFTGSVLAKDPNVTIALHVSTQGLDLSQPAAAQAFLHALEGGRVGVVCTHGDRVDLVPVDDPRGCYEKALAEAIRSVKAPLLTQIYLANHAIQGGATGWTYVAAPCSAEVGAVGAVRTVCGARRRLSLGRWGLLCRGAAPRHATRATGANRKGAPVAFGTILGRDHGCVAVKRIVVPL